MLHFLRIRQINGFLLIVSMALCASMKLAGQCVPDTTNCKDTGNPGEICPSDLPDAGLTNLYDETVTIIPPGTYEFFGNPLSIFYIEIDSVKNLPPGIDYFPNADIFYPDTAYCIQLSGTPTHTGAFPLSIFITATVDFGGPLRYSVVDDTSLVINVFETLGLEPDPGTEFQVYPNVPNPFSFRTSMSCYTPRQDRIELSVYNILGVLVHNESESVSPGKHKFRFDGAELQPGTYLYRVKNSEAYFTGRFMKSQ